MELKWVKMQFEILAYTTDVLFAIYAELMLIFFPFRRLDVET